MEKVNLIITGQLKNKKKFISSTLSFVNNPLVEEKIISTWTEEVDKNKALFVIFEKLGLKSFMKNNLTTKIDRYFTK